PDSLRDERIRQSAVTALAPFATATTGRDLLARPPQGMDLVYAGTFAQAYLGYSSGSAGQSPAPRPYPRSNAPFDFLVRKYLPAPATPRSSPPSAVPRGRRAPRPRSRPPTRPAPARTSPPR